MTVATLDSLSTTYKPNIVSIQVVYDVSFPYLFSRAGFGAGGVFDIGPEQVAVAKHVHCHVRKIHPVQLDHEPVVEAGDP